MRTDSLDLEEGTGVDVSTRPLPALLLGLPAPPKPATGRAAAVGAAPRDPRPPRTTTDVIRGRGRPPAVRPDLQGLRAVAVGLVVLYHLRPDVLSGGFVGVDVFFVISGFLIVGSLGREAARSGTISLRTFFARRVRRLLPASTVVLVVTAVATMALMPVARWRTTAEGVVASVLQVQNWWQAVSSGYAEAATAVSPVQHYWSLAVEEQFYVVAPLLLLLACWVAARTGRDPGSVVLAVMATVVVLSFAHSVLLSRSHDELAYFATTTRMWELGCGGLLALAATRGTLPPAVRAAATWLGLAAICYSALTFHTGMAFPGWVAAVPVLGTVLVILGGQPGPDGSSHEGLGQRLLGLRPMTYVGDVSYSLYLWHWPVIVFWVFWVNRTPTKEECAVLLLVSVALAHLTTRFVETPLRHPRNDRIRRTGGGRPQGALRLAMVLTTVSLVAAGGPLAYLHYRAYTLGSQTLDADHPGAATALPEQIPPRESGVSLIPDPATAGEDQSIVRGGGCQAFDLRRMTLDQCVFGDVTSPLAIALTGDSHAGQFSTPLDAVGRLQGWRLQTIVRNGCPFTAAPKMVDGEEDAICVEHNEMALAALLEARPRAVVTSAMRPQGYEDYLGQGWSSEEELVRGYRQMWQRLIDAGIPVIVIRDTPLPDYLAPDCAETHGAVSGECSMTRDEAEAQADPLLEAAHGMEGVQLVDLTPHLCNSQVCPSVIGNVLVYRDRSHLSDALALSLTQGLAAALEGRV